MPLKQFKNTPNGLIEVPIDWSPEDLILELKEQRDSHWGKGALLPTEFGENIRVQTNVEAVANLTGCVTILRSNPQMTISWGLGGGRSIELNLPQIEAVGLVQFTHIQAVRSRYDELYSEIMESKDFESRRLIASKIADGWPA